MIRIPVTLNFSVSLALCALAFVFAFATATGAFAQPQELTPQEHALRILDDFMTAFNARDTQAWTKTMHFPHVRFASGETRTDRTADEMLARFSFADFAQRFDWHHSAWLKREVVQSGPDKVHVAVRFGRYRDDGTLTTAFDSLYIVVKRNGHWGIVSRSSFAP